MTRAITRSLAVAAAGLALGFSSASAQEEFELAMVIKSTNNPYYNATLSGALMAAEEIGGTAKNYGSTSSTISRNDASPRSRSHRAIRMQSCRP